MSPCARRAALFAVTLAACSPAPGRRAEVPADTAAVGAPAADAAAPATSATRSAAAAEQTARSATRGDTAADSLRGVVERIGSEPAARLVVRGVDGVVCAVQMAAPPPFEGLEVTLWGRRDPSASTMIPGVSCAFAARRYAVRAVDGIAAVDGMLLESETSYALALASGARPLLRHVPAALRTQVGARIFWAGPLDRAPAAYGVLEPAP